MVKKILNLLVIDEEQLYAEHLVKLLSAYYDEVNLGFLDDKTELIKNLRLEWDVLIFNRAYDMTLTDVVGIIQEQGSLVSIIGLVQNPQTARLNEFGHPELMHGDMVQTLTVGQDEAIVMAVCLQADYIKCRRQMANLRLILKEAEQRANILIKNSKSAVAYIDQGVHIFANDPYLEMFGYKAMEDIIGVPVVDLIAGGDNIKGFKQFLRKFDKGDRSQVEFAFESKRTDGSTFASKLQLAAATLDGEPVTQMIIQQNMAGDAELVQKLAEAERQDSLTGLHNRTAFGRFLEKAYQQTQSGDIKSASLLYIRMDNAATIHSSTGIAGLDVAIKQVAYMLDEQFKTQDTLSLARFSDSSFAAIVYDIHQDDVLAFADTVCQKVAGMLIEVGSRTVTTTLSIGVVMMDMNSPEPQTLLERAVDTTAQIDIESETDKVKLFDISKLAGEDDGVMAEYLQNAIANNTLNLSYQTIYDIEQDNSNLFEVYVTLPQADGTQMTFEKIVPIAKKHQLLDKLDRWVLVNACKHLKEIRQTHPQTQILVSLSSATLNDSNLTNIVTQLVRAIGGDSGALVLQFNEQDVVDYMAQAKRQFLALQHIDCRLGIQSFGSTTKSDDVLAHLTPNLVRLARSYVKDLDRETNLNTLTTLINTVTPKGAAVMIPHISDASTMSIAWSVGARFLQGDYLQPATETIMYVPAAE